MNEVALVEVKKFSAEIRSEVLKMLQWRTYGHLGGALSIVEVLSVLYKRQLRHDPNRPHWDERDYLVLSKGHAGPGLYATLAVAGYYDKAMLYTLNEGGTSLPSHPDRTKTPGVDMTTGSLGQGVSVAAGIGYALRLEKRKQYVYVIVGDGELNEGQCWEAFAFIAHHKLSNVIVFIDDNKKQLDGTTQAILNPYDIVAKMEAFGFHTQHVKGNDEEAIEDAIMKAKEADQQAQCIVLDTIKGQGVPHFETMLNNHSVKFNVEDNRIIDECIAQLQAFIKGGK